MKHLAWLTDVHLNFLRPPVLEAFLAHVAENHLLIEAEEVLATADVRNLADASKAAAKLRKAAAYRMACSWCRRPAHVTAAS